MTKRPEADTRPPWGWQEGPFNPALQKDRDHAWFELHYVPNPEDPDVFYVAAYVSPPKEHVFTVQLLPHNLPETINAGPLVYRIRQELDFYLTDIREKDPEKYLRYHIRTASNVYSQFSMGPYDV